jgi:stage III sporulation protein SpoIIIAA
MEKRKITDDLHALLDVLPPAIAQAVQDYNDSEDLLEVILDLGRLPTARYVDREVVLSQIEVTHTDIDYVVRRIGEFDADNRAGLERTLHRISSIRNRRSHIVGLTTMLREAARILAESKRVIIVDTSNEIGGDGDVPHPAVGRARRMQVSTPSLQHEVMIEAVENHNPEAIVIDEIGRELEAAAARTIAERGVQLIGTAHGNSLENLLLNPTLSDLIGGIESVTLSDEEARRRGTQKTVLERRSPPTFDVLIEIQNRDRLAVHQDVATAVDAILRGYPQPPEVRNRLENGEIRIEHAPPPPRVPQTSSSGRRQMQEMPFERNRTTGYAEERPNGGSMSALNEGQPPREHRSLQPVKIYPYGVARNRLSQAAKRLGVPAVLVNEAGDAEVFVTLRAYYRKRQRPIMDAENRNIPIYVLRANTINQMQQFLSDLFNLSLDSGSETGIDPFIQETQAAIQAVMNGERWVELQPASSTIRRMQHQMAREANLYSHSYGKEPRRRVRIFRE